MRLGDTIGESFERASYHFEERISLIRDHQLGISNTSILLTPKKNVCSSWLQTNTRKIHERDKKPWLLEYNVDPCDRGLKLGHSYHIYNVYLCRTYANLSIDTTIQMWIHAGTSYNILHRNLGSKLWALNKYLGSSSRLPQSTILSM